MGASVETGPRCSCLELGGHILHNAGQTYPESLVYKHKPLLNIQIIYNVGQTYPESLVYNTNHKPLLNIQIIYNAGQTYPESFVSTQTTNN